MAHTQEIQTAVLKLILDEPFFAAKFMGMRFERDDTVPTACTDGRFIKYNGEWLGQFERDYIVGVLAHEVLHVANKHHLRSEGLDHKRANIAGDLAINCILRDCGFKLPTDCLYPAKYGLPDGKHMEWYYMNLPENERGDGEGTGFGEFSPMKNEDGSSMTDAQKSEEAAMIELDLQRAQKAARMAGKNHQAIDEMLGNILAPKLDWRDILRDFITRTAKNQWDWSRRSRRTQSVYLPQRKGEELKPIALYLDQSGSVDNADQEQFFGELNDIVNNSMPCTVRVAVFDTKVLAERTYTQDDYPIQPLRATCGGTDLRVPFDHADQYEDLACCIVMTDLMGPQYDTERKYPTLWISTTPAKDAGEYMPKYGEIAYL
jgi:predicted metal-dependent peptidase